MYRILPAISIFPVLLFLVSCQTLSKDECIAADWRVIGEQDGNAGLSPQQQFGKHVKACEKAGIVPDQTLWNDGYQRGLVNFCTPLQGLNHGQTGGTYNSVCPANLEAGFLNGYNLGNREWSIRQEIRSLENRIRSNDREIDDVDDKLSDGKIDERDGRRRIRRLRDDNRDLNRDIGSAESDLARVRRDIDYFRQNPGIAVYN